MMLAHRFKADVADDDHFVVFLRERFLEQVARIAVQAGEQFGVHAGDAGRRFLQTLAVGVFADGQQNLAHRRFDAFVIDVRRGAVLGRRRGALSAGR